MTDQLSTELDDAVPGIRVDRLADQVWRVLVPSVRWPHDYVSLAVEGVDGGWMISDAGDLSRLVGDDVFELVRVLDCAGAEMDLAEDGMVTSLVPRDEPIGIRVLSFAHHLSAAPVVWHALGCMTPATAVPVQETRARAMAKSTRERLVSRLGPTSRGVIHIDRKVRSRGETVRMPLTIAPPGPFSLPSLVSAFVDMEAPEQGVAAAKRSATFAFEVVRELHIPKFLLVKGDTSAVEHFAEFFDQHSVTALPYEDAPQLEEDARDAVERFGLATSG